MLNKQQMLDAIDGLLRECETLHAAFLQNYRTWTPEFSSCLKASESTVEAIFGVNSNALQSFKSIYFLPPLGTQHQNKSEEAQAQLVWFDSGLRYAHATLTGFRYSVERLAVENPVSSNPYIFISHGGATRIHIDGVKELLIALGLSPVVVADLPNLNMSINDKVLYYMGLCAGAIVLATVEDETTAKEKRARPNVENEIGSLQVSTNIANRIVYLKEPDVLFASNYREKVWIPFQKENVESSFVQIIRELRAFGFTT